jgi:tyrosine-specific transport protein
MLFNRGILGGSLLVMGTCIGAGMLSLPFMMAAGSFLHTIIFFCGCCSVMLITAFLMLELSLWFPKEHNLCSMAEKTIGPFGRHIVAITTVFFSYAILVAYIVGGATIIQQALSLFFSDSVNVKVLIVGYAGLAMLIVFFGAFLVDRVNRFLMGALIVLYLMLIIALWSNTLWPVESTTSVDFPLLGKALPIVLTSFGFHLLIPSLKDYLQSNRTVLNASLLIGSVMVLLIYLVWIYVIIRVVPVESTALIMGLREMGQQAEPMVFLNQSLEQCCSHRVAGWMQGFSFFALMTSLIGVSLGLQDFFKDIFLRCSHSCAHVKGWSLFATFALPLCIALYNPGVFINALAYGGVFGALLLIIYPSWMVLRGRKRYSKSGVYKVWGGALMPWFMLIFGCGVIAYFLMMP